MTMPYVTPGEPHACLCCGYLTLKGRPGSYSICPVCLWEDDYATYRDGPNALSGPNHVSLHQAQRNFADFGASSEKRRQRARPPLPHEIPS
jgi:hypothetical protein